MVNHGKSMVNHGFFHGRCQTWAGNHQETFPPSDEDFLTDLRRARKRDDVRLVSRCLHWFYPKTWQFTMGRMDNGVWVDGVLPFINYQFDDGNIHVIM
jgi:hypothetical protein